MRKLPHAARARRGMLVLRAAALALAALAACGAAGALPPDSAVASFADDLQTALNNLQGNEITGTVSGQFNGVQFEASLVGFAFCAPPNPTAPPAATATAPLNLYGCQNAAVVDVVGSAGDSIQFSVTAAQLFLDVHTVRQKTPFCGEFGSGTVAADGYALGAATIGAWVRTEPLGACTLYKLVPGSVQLSLSPTELQSADACLQLYAVLGNFVLDSVKPQIVSAVELVLTAALRQRNHDVCGEVPTPAASWGSVKARFD